MVATMPPEAPAVLAADTDSFHRFHSEVLPARIAAGNGALAFADLEDLGTLAVRTPAGSWTYVPRSGSVELLEGEATADAVVAVDLDAWLGLVSDLDTAPGLFYTDRASVPVGNPLRFMRWEPGLRALFHGLPVFDPDNVDLRDLDGEPLDPTLSFTLDEIGDTGQGGAAARHFLRTAGYLYVPDVFDGDEVAAMLVDAAILADEALAPRRHFLRALRRYRPHVRSEAEERILEEKANTGARAFSRLFDELVSDMRFQMRRGEDVTELGEEETLALQGANEVAQRLRQRSEDLGNTVTILGPVPAALARLKGIWRVQILLKSSSRRQLREVIGAAGGKRKAGIRQILDVDPVSML